VGHVRRVGEARNACKILVGKCQGNTSPLSRLRRRRKENSTVDSQFFCLCVKFEASSFNRKLFDEQRERETTTRYLSEATKQM
jgi:hypothetical protein